MLMVFKPHTHTLNKKKLLEVQYTELNAPDCPRVLQRGTLIMQTPKVVWTFLLYIKWRRVLGRWML
jgi:hypothetical protein